MQSLTAPPRRGLTHDQVLGLLTSPAATWDGGAELLTPELSVREDISTTLFSGTVKRTMAAEIHGLCDIVLRRELTWGTDLVRLFTTVSDRPVNPTLSARFNLGVYCLTTPRREIGMTPLTWNVTGCDRLYLLKRQVGDSYAVEAGAKYLDAVRAAIVASGLSGATVLLDSTAADKVLPEAMVWPLLPQTTAAKVDATGSAISSDAPGATESGPTTWLAIVNDLLAAVGYRGLWADENGYFRSGPYVRPSERASEWTLTIGGVVRQVHAAAEAQMTRDEWGLPNKWVFIMRQPSATPSEGAGLYTVIDAEGIGKRGGVVWPVQVQLDAADQAALVVQGDARVAADKRVATTITRQTRPFPAVGHADVMTLVDAELGGTVKVQTASWTQDLFGGNTSFEWGVVS